MSPSSPPRPLTNMPARASSLGLVLAKITPGRGPPGPDGLGRALAVTMGIQTMTLSNTTTVGGGCGNRVATHPGAGRRGPGAGAAERAPAASPALIPGAARARRSAASGGAAGWRAVGGGAVGGGAVGGGAGRCLRAEPAAVLQPGRGAARAAAGQPPGGRLHPVDPVLGHRRPVHLGDRHDRGADRGPAGDGAEPGPPAPGGLVDRPARAGTGWRLRRRRRPSPGRPGARPGSGPRSATSSCSTWPPWCSSPR